PLPDWKRPRQRSVGRAARPEAAEGNRVAVGLDRRDGVFPLAARLAADQIGRARLERDGPALEAVANPAAQAERTGGTDADSDDLGEHRPIAVPADRRAGLVL